MALSGLIIIYMKNIDILQNGKSTDLKVNNKQLQTENQKHMGLVTRKPVFGVPAKRVSNQSPQLQRLAGKLKFYL